MCCMDWESDIHGLILKVYILAGQNLTLTGDKKLVSGHQKWIEGVPKNNLI